MQKMCNAKDDFHLKFEPMALFFIETELQKSKNNFYYQMPAAMISIKKYLI